MATATTPTVKGNPMHKFNSQDLTDPNLNLGILVAQDPSSVQNKLLGYLAPDSISLRLNPSPNMAAALNNPNYSNNYTAIIPRNWTESKKYQEAFGSEQNHKDVINILPNLESINAQYLYNVPTDHDLWRIKWESDSYFGTQTAEYKGLVFKRDAKNGQWASWQFADDSQMIGTLKMDYNNNTDINKNVMGWIPINNDVSISQAKYPRLVAYIKRNFQVNKVYWDVVGGVRLVNASGLYPRFTGNHQAGFTTNPDASWAQCGDKIEYANKYQHYSGHAPNGGEHRSVYMGDFFGICSRWNVRYLLGFSSQSQDFDNTGLAINFSYGNSNNETRVKSIFFSLMIYAGYPA